MTPEQYNELENCVLDALTESSFLCNGYKSHFMDIGSANSIKTAYNVVTMKNTFDRLHNAFFENGNHQGTETASQHEMPLPRQENANIFAVILQFRCTLDWFYLSDKTSTTEDGTTIWRTYQPDETDGFGLGGEQDRQELANELHVELNSLFEEMISTFNTINYFKIDNSTPVPEMDDDDTQTVELIL